MSFLWKEFHLPQKLRLDLATLIFCSWHWKENLVNLWTDWRGEYGIYRKKMEWNGSFLKASAEIANHFMLVRRVLDFFCIPVYVCVCVCECGGCVFFIVFANSPLILLWGGIDLEEELNLSQSPNVISPSFFQLLFLPSLVLVEHVNVNMIPLFLPLSMSSILLVL